MTEANDDGNNLVRVNAQVMMRDDSTGGWVPLGGGGLSRVSVRKRILQIESKHEYFIYGTRLSDKTVVLSCTIKKDFEYNKVMPTFHHWRTGDHKFGLTFQTAADARAFDKGVRVAVDDLLDGLHDIPSYWYNHSTDPGEEDIFIAVTLPADRDGGSLSSSGSAATTYSNSSRHTPTTTPLAATTPLPTPDHLHHHALAVNTPDLPPHVHHHHHLHHHHHHVSAGGGLGGGGSLAGGATTTNMSPVSTLSHPGSIATSAPNYYSQSNHLHFHRISYLSRNKSGHPTGKTSPPDTDKCDADKISSLGDAYSYVQLAKNHPLPLHDYSYPMVEALNKADRRDSIASIKKQQQLELVGATGTQHPPMLAGCKRGRKNRRTNRKGGKLRCRHCNETFSEDINSRGSCEYSPDYMRSAIDKVSCISCAQCMLYHCMSDAEGEFPHHPCECDTPTDESCGKKWLGLTLLSLLVPCLWCYLPLRACHRCAVSCRMCGGRHEAS